MFESFAALLILLVLPLLLGATVSTDWIEVFRAGSYPQGEFSEEDVQSLAAKYDPDTFEAPGTLDHQQEGFANGWVEDLKAKGKSLYAKFKQVPEQFAELIKEGRLKNRSVELFKDLDGMGTYLKAVTWLGAKAPQIKGLEDPADALEFDHSGLSNRLAVVHFDEDEGEDEEDEAEGETEGQEEEDEEEEDETEGQEEEGEGESEESEGEEEEGSSESDESSEDSPGTESASDDTEEFSHEAQSEIERLQDENERLREQAEQGGQDQRVEEFERFCEERVPPAVRDEVVALFEAIHTSDTIRFEHDSHESAAEAFQEVVDKLSLTYLFQEVGTEPDDGDGSSAADLETAVRESMAEQGLDV